MVIQWNEELILGIPEIDKQHKQLVELLNNFYEELEKGEKTEAINHFIENLENYLHYHLDFEEQLLEKHNYPDLENHRKTHKMFKNFFSEEKERYLQGDIKALRELVVFTFSWLYSHIMKTDKKYAEFLK